MKNIKCKGVKMGCDKVCQAKKEAAEAEKKAEAAMADAKERMKNLPTASNTPRLTGVDVNVITVGHLLGVHEKKNALTPDEINALLPQARNNQAVMRAAGHLIDPVRVAFGVYEAALFAQTVPLIAKPAARIAVQINGIITLNFAMLPELLGDIALLLVTIAAGLAPIFLSIYKNVLLSMPIEIEILEKYQVDQLKGLVEASKVKTKEAYINSVKKLNCERVKPSDFSDLEKSFLKGFKDCERFVLDNLAEELKKINIDILQIDGVSSMDEKNKISIKNFSNELLEASKKIELLQTGEILEKEFNIEDIINFAIIKINNLVSSGNSIEDAFMEVFCTEIQKKKDVILTEREGIAALEYASELILNNKSLFVNSILGMNFSLNKDSGDPDDGINLENCIKLDDCYNQNLINEFNTLKSIILTQQTSIINEANIENTTDMVNLKNSVFLNSEISIRDHIIVIDDNCLTIFGKSVCDTIDNFKNFLFASVKKNIEKGSLSIDRMKVPSGVSKFELKKSIKLVLDEIKKKLVKQSMDIIINEVVPCKSCKPCEDMIVDLNLAVSKYINRNKENTIRFLRNNIMSSGRDWTITDTNSIQEQKNYLIEQLTQALQRPSGELNLEEEVFRKIALEEEELIKTIKLSLRAL